jgi:hypothetical protein
MVICKLATISTSHPNIGIKHSILQNNLNHCHHKTNSTFCQNLHIKDLMNDTQIILNAIHITQSFVSFNDSYMLVLLQSHVLYILNMRCSSYANASCIDFLM